MDRGHRALAEALIARHNQRLQRNLRSGHMMQSICLPLLTGYLPMGSVAEVLGADVGRPPWYSNGPTWPDHLAWGLDSTAAAVRLLLCIQPVGASMIARTQLERWSSNQQDSSGIDQKPGESTVDWLNRLWSGPGVLLAGNVSTPVGELFADLSELLHGRGRLMPLVWLDIADVSDMPSSEHVQLLDTIGDALMVSLGHIRACLATEADAQDLAHLPSLIRVIRLVTPTQCWIPDLKPLVLPLLPSVIRQPGMDGVLGAAATGHRRVQTALQASQQPEEPRELWPALSLGAHRFRAVLAAKMAQQWEQQVLGDRFKDGGVENTHAEAVLAGEMAAVLAMWLRQEPNRRSPADAFAVCASALRSAQWLWLEDDDRGMGCLRSVIEQVARARTWRLRPDRAIKTELNPNSTPRDWIQEAGWRRLNLLSRALGEFAHGSTKTNWDVARHALVTIQDAKYVREAEEAKHSGRTHALMAMIFILSVECAAWMDTFSQELGEAYRQVIRVDDAQADRLINALMNRAWEKRRTPLR